MKKQNRKLSLNRETIQPLNAQELDGVNGGTLSPATPTVTVITASIVTRLLTCQCPTH